MTSKIDICNLALIEAEYDETITNIDERSVAAERCKRLYDVCRKELLCKYPWSFATRFVNLSLLTEDIEGYKYVYVYPSDALKLSATYLNEDEFRNKRLSVKQKGNERVGLYDGRKVIFSDTEKSFAEIIVDEEVEENFSNLFVRLLYLEMALRLAKLSGADNEYLKLLASQILQAEQEAKGLSVYEDDNHDSIGDDYYIRVRG
jgi:hypothetical protein